VARDRWFATSINDQADRWNFHDRFDPERHDRVSYIPSVSMGRGPEVDVMCSWYFDTEAGKKEILYRRIGRDEISTIRVCHELVVAQKEFYSTQHNEYAQKIFSGEGQHNGLLLESDRRPTPEPHRAFGGIGSC
jgi:hypothetical protein